MRPFSRTRGRSGRPSPSSVVTTWAAARFSACCSRRSALNSSPRMGPSASANKRTDGIVVVILQYCGPHFTLFEEYVLAATTRKSVEFIIQMKAESEARRRASVQVYELRFFGARADFARLVRVRARGPAASVGPPALAAKVPSVAPILRATSTRRSSCTRADFLLRFVFIKIEFLPSWCGIVKSNVPPRLDLRMRQAQ